MYNTAETFTSASSTPHSNRGSNIVSSEEVGSDNRPIVYDNYDDDMDSSDCLEDHETQLSTMDKRLYVSPTNVMGTDEVSDVSVPHTPPAAYGSHIEVAQVQVRFFIIIWISLKVWN